MRMGGERFFDQKEIQMIKSLIALVLSLSIGLLTTVYATEPPAEKLELMDGSTLYLHPDGTGRMVDAHGKPMAMADGEEMNTKDGRTVMMKNKKMWIEYGPPGKGKKFLKTD
jgi:Copper resistance protein K